MNRFVQVMHLIGLNFVPIAGLAWAGWSDGTALALYWIETLLVLFLVAARIRIHRRLTNKRGHFTTEACGSYGRSFLIIGLCLLLVPVPFVAVAVQHVDVHALARGLMFSSLFLLLGFLLDLTTIRGQSFMWIHRMSNFTWWRALMVALAGLAGTVGMGFDFPRSGVIAFIVLKIYTDLAANWDQYDPREPPRLLRWFTRDPQRFSEAWAAEYDDRHTIYLQDEEPFDGRPSRPVTYLMDEKSTSESAGEQQRRRGSRPGRLPP